MDMVKALPAGLLGRIRLCSRAARVILAKTELQGTVRSRALAHGRDTDRIRDATPAGVTYGLPGLKLDLQLRRTVKLKSARWGLTRRRPAEGYSTSTAPLPACLIGRERYVKPS
jgi:hypothetical protein